MGTLLVPAGSATAYHLPHRLPAGYDVQRIDSPSPATRQHFGNGAVNLGDVDGDGEDDILVGLDQEGDYSGKVWVFSGEDGSLIHEIPAPDPDAHNPDGGDNGDGFGTYVGRIFDIGSCGGFGGAPGADCPNTAGAIATEDGVDDILVSAIGVDVATTGFVTEGNDQGMTYVIDGATGAVLYRIVMPTSDRTTQLTIEPNAEQGAAFGRSILSPAGNAACAGFMGFGTCRYGLSSAVGMGDVDGAGAPDIVVGASDFSETTASNPECDEPNDPGTSDCFEAGRAYVYRGEDLDGLTPSTPLDAPLFTIHNPRAQWDNPQVSSKFYPESFGWSAGPVGDLGKCNAETPAPGTFCLSDRTASTSPSYTGPPLPEFTVAAPRLDDFGGVRDTGWALTVDGPTGRIVDEYPHPQPEATAVFGRANYSQPAIGDAGASTAPDVYHPAIVQTVVKKGQGRGFVMNGEFVSGGGEHANLSVFDDPTPAKSGNFGTSAAGLGDVARDSRGEILVGAYGPEAPETFGEFVGDVTIFDPVSEDVLQTIVDPDQQEGSGFGRSVVPLGDLNEDQFMDFAVGAGKFDGPVVNQGRMYIFRSNDEEPECPDHLGDPRPDIIGTSGDDTLIGTGAEEIICGLGGDDEVEGLGGDDLIELGDDDDDAVGGSGDDVVKGAAGDDTAHGGSGSDTLAGNGGNDRLRGQSSSDNLKGGGGADDLDGGSGTDQCAGGPGADELTSCEI